MQIHENTYRNTRYSQIKFNVLSVGITSNRLDKLPGIIVASLVGLIWISGYPVVNFIPRWYLGALLVYAGLYKHTRHDHARAQTHVV